MATKAEPLAPPACSDRKQRARKAPLRSSAAGDTFRPRLTRSASICHRALSNAHAGGRERCEARSYYCGTIAAEFMHIADPERRQWLQEQMEQVPPKPDQKHILTQLIRGRSLRTGDPVALSGHQTFLARGSHGFDSFSQSRLREECNLRSYKGDSRDESPWPSERNDEHYRP